MVAPRFESRFSKTVARTLLFGAALTSISACSGQRLDSSTGGAGGAGGSGGSAGSGDSTGSGGSGGAGAASWERIGPWNFYDDVNGNGPTGTCASAIADPSSPDVMYQGGQNNSAATGVLKTVDGGKHWVGMNKGLADPRVRALLLDPQSPQTVYVGTPSGVFKSTDAAASWKQEMETQAFGGVRAGLLWVVVQGSTWLVAATDKGIAYRPKDGGAWSLSAPPAGAAATGVYSLSAAKPTDTGTTLYAVNDGGAVYRITATSKGLTWVKTTLTFNTLSVDPTNSQHVLGSRTATGTADDYTIFESTDGGKTSHQLSKDLAWYIGFDPKDATGKTVWRGGQGGVLRSTNGGVTWEGVPAHVQSREGYTQNTGSTDVQQLMLDFAGGEAFCSDQGLTKYVSSTKSLVDLNGDAKTTIAVSVSISRPDPGTAHVLTTMWDWGPTESWDGGQSWAATTWYGSSYWSGPDGLGAPIMGEGGQVFAIPSAADGKPHVVMHDGDQTVFYSDDGGKKFTPGKLPSSPQGQQSALYNVFDWARDPSGKATGVIYLGARQGGSSGAILRSADFGKTWAAWGRKYTQAEMPNTMAVDPANAAHVVVGAGACLYSTKDDGKSWSTCVTPSKTHAALRKLTVRPDDPAKMLLLTDAGEVLRSTDGGETWTAVSDTLITGTLPQAPTSRLLSYAPSGKTIVLTAASPDPGSIARHVFASRDDGATWTDETHDIVTIQFNHLAWDGADLYLATSGEGVLRWKGFDH